jgi:cell division protein FtsB
MNANRAWIGIFAIWALFLSGAFSRFVGSPGVVQAIRLKVMLDAKNKSVKNMQDAVMQLQAQADLLEKSRTAQQREIRSTLGYAGKDEIIFDFSNADRI